MSPLFAEPWYKSYQTLIVGILSISLSIIAATAAWISVQRQIHAQQMVVELQINNQRELIQLQRLEQRKQRRLDYLRKQVPELAEAAAWLDEIKPSLKQLHSYMPPGRAFTNPAQTPSDELLTFAPILIATLKSMPTMPYLPGNSGSSRRDNLVAALSEMISLMHTLKAEQKITDSNRVADTSMSEQINSLVRRIRAWDAWDDYSKEVHGLLIAREIEMNLLEEDIEFKVIPANRSP